METFSGIPVRAGAYKINLEAYYLDQSIAEQQINLNVTAGLPVVELSEVISDSTPTLTLQFDVQATGGDDPSMIAVVDLEIEEPTFMIGNTVLKWVSKDSGLTVFN